MSDDLMKELYEALRAMRDHANMKATQWRDGGGSPSHPVWPQAANALAAYEARNTEQRP